MDPGRRALEDLRGRAPELAEQALLGCEERIPALAAQPGRLRAEGLRIIEFALRSAFELAADQQALGPDRLAVFRRYFDGAAARGIPLGLQLHVAGAALTAGFQAWWASTDPDGAEGLLALSRWVEANLPDIQWCAAQSYCPPGEPPPSGVLADMLLAGLDPGLLGPVEVARDHLVLAPAGGVSVPAASVRIPGGRDPLWGWWDGLAVALLPVAGRHTVEDLILAARAGLQGTRDTAGGAIVVGAVPAGPQRPVPLAADDAIRVAAFAAAVPGASGLYLPEDVLLERAIDRVPAAMDEFGVVLDRVRDVPELMMTLRTLYDVDLDRTRAAAALRINRRTLTNRLNRIETLTGIRPTSPRGIQMLMTAMTVTARRG